jgi:hypothetical protein
MATRRGHHPGRHRVRWGDHCHRYHSNALLATNPTPAVALRIHPANLNTNLNTNADS